MKKYFAVLFIAILVLLAGCGKEEHPQGSTCYTLYFVGNEHTKLVSKEYWTTTTEQKELVEELLWELSRVPEKLEYTPPFGGVVTLNKWSLLNGKLLLDFEQSYAKLSNEAEVLTRAAIVKTFAQIDSVNYVSFQVEGEPLTDVLGNLVGAMYEDSFIYNEGAQINSYEEVTLSLYFANKDGDALIKTDRTFMYNTNIAMEKIILEQLIAGPEGRRSYATINPETKVLGVVIKDNVCYVNLNNTFLTQVYSVSPEVVIYSIVNSLCQITNVDKVQISVDGDNSIVFRETMQLGVAYEENMKIVENGKKN